MNNQRKHERIAFPAEIKLMHPDFGSVVAQARDMSDGGVFLFLDNPLGLPVGTEVEVQAQDAAGESPLVKARVVRIETRGVALMFVRED